MNTAKSKTLGDRFRKIDVIFNKGGLFSWKHDHVSRYDVSRHLLNYIDRSERESVDSGKYINCRKLIDDTMARFCISSFNGVIYSTRLVL